MDLLIYFTGCPFFKVLNYCRCLCFVHLGEHVASGLHPIFSDVGDKNDKKNTRYITYLQQWVTSHWQARGIRTSSRQLRQRECALKGNWGTGCGKTLISDCCSRCVCSASQSRISSHFGQVARSLSDLELPEINFLLREAGWLVLWKIKRQLNGQRHLGQRFSSAWWKEQGYLAGQKGQALQRMVQKKGARLEGFQRYPKIMGMGWLLTFRQQQMFDWPIVACPIPMLAHPQILVARQLLAQVQSSSLFLGRVGEGTLQKVEVATWIHMTRYIRAQRDRMAMNGLMPHKIQGGNDLNFFTIFHLKWLKWLKWLQKMIKHY